MAHKILETAKRRESKFTFPFLDLGPRHWTGTWTRACHHLYKITLFQPRSVLEGSAGPNPMVRQKEDAPQGPHVHLGCLKEAPGIEAHLGTAWPSLNWPPELPVTTHPR